MAGMSENSQRISCVQYMSPWIKNLSVFSNATSPHFERSGSRLRDCIRTISELCVSYPMVCAFLDATDNCYMFLRSHQQSRSTSGVKLANLTQLSWTLSWMNWYDLQQTAALDPIDARRLQTLFPHCRRLVSEGVYTPNYAR